MALLKDLRTEPVDSWRYLQPETGVWIIADAEHFGFLVDLVVQHRTYKGIEPKDRDSVALDIQRQICMRIPEDRCSPEPGETRLIYKDQYRSLSSSTIIAFTTAIFSWIAGGGQLCEKAESERRAAICRRCVFNRIGRTCACQAVSAMIESLVPKGRRENGLTMCGICGCALLGKTICPDDVVRDSNRGRGYVFPRELGCWQADLNPDQPAIA